MKRENNPLCLTRNEFEEYKRDHKFCNKPYEFYRVYPILNHKHQQELNAFLRGNPSPVDILKEAARLLEEETEELNL